MAFTNSSLVSYTRISPNRTKNRNHAIDTITIHCVVGQCSVETLGSIFAPESRQASSNYGVGVDGRIGMYCEEKDRSWCSSSASNDHRAITIEVASDTTHPYAVNAKAYAALIDLCVDICKRNGIKKLVWSTDKNQRVNHLNGCNMTVHRDYANKSCPGQYLYDRHGEIAAAVNARLSEGTEPEVKPDTPAVTIVEGSLVKFKDSATKYNPTSVTIPNWVKKDYNHIVTKTTSGGKTVVKGGKTCVLLGKKVKKSGGSEVAGINTWVAVDNLTLVTATPAPSYRTHTVVKGDSLWAIAKKYLGDGSRYPEIKTLNNLKSNVIYSGWKLLIPNK